MDRLPLELPVWAPCTAPAPHNRLMNWAKCAPIHQYFPSSIDTRPGSSFLLMNSRGRKPEILISGIRIPNGGEAMRISLRKLAVFDAVARHASVSRGAHEV